MELPCMVERVTSAKAQRDEVEELDAEF